ncbi:MAG: hypothetical protein AB1632_00445 [Nitrospirota bacterium]
MEKYTCPTCHKTTYTAYRAMAYVCPYCNVEKLLIFNPLAFNTGHDMSDAKIIFDRRGAESRVEPERRGDHNVECIPIAWLVIKHRNA